MKKIDLKLILKSKLFFGVVIIFLSITSAFFYTLKEKERKIKIFTQKQLIRTIESKKIVENNLTETIKAKEAVTSALKKELEEKENRITQTLDKLEKEVTARREAEAQLIIAIREKRALEVKVKKFSDISKTIELEKIIIKALPELTGRVLASNKEHGFIVVNMGKSDNLKIGDILSVYRDNEFIGRAQVERVSEKISAAAVLPDWQDAEFKENDEVKII
jgi:hypothetical protein